MQRVPKTKRRNSLREVDPIDYWFFIGSHKIPRQHSTSTTLADVIRRLHVLTFSPETGRSGLRNFELNRDLSPTMSRIALLGYYPFVDKASTISLVLSMAGIFIANGVSNA